MKVQVNKTNKGFTLIEMIGVLAVIAILAAVLIPKVFEAINNSRINNAAMTCQSAKTALIDHYAKYGSLAVNGLAPSTALTTAQLDQFDTVLLSEQFMDKLLQTKISAPSGPTSGTRVALLDLSAATSASAVTATSATFDLDGSGPTSDITGSYAAVAILPQVTLNDAKDLSDRIDGANLGFSTSTSSTAAGTFTSDLKGRVKYDFGSAATGTVYVYLTHR